MEEARSSVEGKTISEKFKFWEAIYSCPASSFPVNQEFIEKWSEILKKIPEDSYLKIALDRILPSNQEEALDFSDEFKRMQEILPAAERLSTSGYFEDAVTFFSFFWEYDTYLAKIAEKKKKLEQTEAAHKARSKEDIYRPKVSVLWNYLCMVEQKIHPMKTENVEKDEVAIKVNSIPTEDQLANEVYPIIADKSSEYRPEKTIHVLTSQETALDRVFRDNRDAIMTRLPDSKNEADARKVFEKVFQIFTQDYIEMHKTTVTGYIPKKRKERRTEESREKSRQAALKIWSQKKKDSKKS